MAQQPLVEQGLLIIEALRSQSDSPHSVGLLWASDLALLLGLYLKRNADNVVRTRKVSSAYEILIGHLQGKRTELLQQKNV
jgi:hypothetical protein